MLFGLPATLQGLISTFLWATAPSLQPSGRSDAAITFHLRHQHAVLNESRIVFSDMTQGASFGNDENPVFSIPVHTTRIPRPKSFEVFTNARRNWRPSSMATPIPSVWDNWDVITPDVSKRSTLYQLGKMAANSYVLDNSTTDWYDISDDKWDSIPYGWAPEDDGLRGHIFVSDDNSTVVISIKGTSPGMLVGGGGPTVRKDKLNDNLLFSCCCARVGPTWSTVCDCYKGNYRCDVDCVESALEDDGLFYPIGLNLYNNVTYLYPNANIWLTGHSMGGSVASLMGTTFGAPVVAFESPAERMAWQRLHLPIPPSTSHITHVYNTGDPIPQGACTGVTSLCAIGGFALESRCHTGQVILYDTVQKLGWSVDVRNHGIIVVLDKILAEDGDWKMEFNEEEDEIDDDDGPELSMRPFRWGWWPGSGKKSGEEEEEDKPRKRYREVPLPRPAVDVEGTDGVCTDCFSWEYGNFKNSNASLIVT